MVHESGFPISESDRGKRAPVDSGTITGIIAGSPAETGASVGDAIPVDFVLPSAAIPCNLCVGIESLRDNILLYVNKHIKFFSAN